MTVIKFEAKAPGEGAEQHKAAADKTPKETPLSAADLAPFLKLQALAKNPKGK